ncbi:MAG: MoxR family ATPase, partial [Candidatus Limnocylindrales bacterium]
MDSPIAAATRDFWRNLRGEVAKAVVGQDAALRLIVLALLADGHVLIEDVPGTGKTLLARAVARALGLATARVQGTPDLLPTDVTGSSLFEGGGL